MFSIEIIEFWLQTSPIYTWGGIEDQPELFRFRPIIGLLDSFKSIIQLKGFISNSVETSESILSVRLFSILAQIEDLNNFKLG